MISDKAIKGKNDKQRLSSYLKRGESRVVWLSTASYPVIRLLTFRMPMYLQEIDSSDWSEESIQVWVIYC